MLYLHRFYCIPQKKKTKYPIGIWNENLWIQLFNMFNEKITLETLIERAYRFQV